MDRLYFFAAIIVMAACGCDLKIPYISQATIDDHPEYIASSICRLKVVACEQSDNWKYVWFTLHNSGVESLSIRDVTLDCTASDFNPTTLCYLSSDDIYPDCYEYGVFRTPLGITSDRRHIAATIQKNNAARILKTEVRATAKLIDEVTFSVDRRRVFAYITFPTQLPNQKLPACKINGKSVQIVSFSILPNVQNGSDICLELPNDAPSVERRILIEVDFPDQSKFARACMVWPHFYTGQTQYDFPLRVVSTTTNDDDLELELYNESNSYKSDLIVDQIFVDGVNTSIKCDLPSMPIRADRQRYSEDSVVLRVPRFWRNATQRNIELSYHLLPPRISDTTSADLRKFKIRFSAVRGLKLPIGHGNGSTLDRCACIYHGGLRPSMDYSALRNELIECKRLSPDAAVYPRCEDGELNEEIERYASCGDFFVISPPRYLRKKRNNAIEDTISYLQSASKLKRSFVVSLFPDADCKFSSEDLKWLTLVSLAEGSKGILWTNSLKDEFTDTTKMPTPDCLEPWRNVIAPSHPISLPHTCNMDGMFVRTVMSGPNDIVLFVVNKWCSRLSNQGGEPFSLAPRHDVNIGLDIGRHWQVGRIWDMTAGREMPFRMSEGCLSLDLPKVAIGRIVLISREASDTSQRPHVAVHELDDLTLNDTQPSLMPIRSPFIDLGRVEPGSCHRLTVECLNASDRQIETTVQSIGVTTSNPAKVLASTVQIEPRSKASVGIELTMPTSTGNSVTRIKIFSKIPPFDGFEAFVDADCASLVSCVPAAVDFGTISGIVEKVVVIKSHDPNLKIESVSSNEQPVRSIVTSDRKSFQFSPAGGKIGQFKGSLDVVVNGDAIGRRTLTLPFNGRRIRSINAFPSRLVMSGWNSLPERQCKITHYLDQPIKLVEVNCNDKRVELLNVAQGKSLEATFLVRVSTREESFESVITAICSADGEEELSLKIPIRFIAQKTGNGRTVFKDNTVPDLLETVQGTVRMFQEFDLPADSPNWVMMHRLLMFADKEPRLPNYWRVIHAVTGQNSGREGVFTLKRGKPCPLTSGRMFDHQHHQDQFLKAFGLTKAPLTTPISIGRDSFTLLDALESSKFNINDREMLSWTVIAYASYLRSGEKWKNKYNQDLTLALLTKELLKQQDDTCFGSHQYCAIASIVARPELKGDKDMQAVWPVLEDRIINKCRELRGTQGKNGSFQIPERFMNDPRIKGVDIPAQVGIHYTGHTFEWLAIALSKEQLAEPWVIDAARYLTMALESEYPNCENLVPFDSDERCWQYGFVSHAVSGLSRWHSKLIKMRTK